MNNADKFKQIFDLYATELWAMSEKDFLAWLNAECDVSDTNVGDLISRQAALDIIDSELNGWLTDDERLHLEGVAIGIACLPRIDAVPVVRCKDCRWGRETCGNIECFADVNVPTEYHSYDWFCPNGERSEEDG